MVSLNVSSGILTASPLHLGFRLYVNKSYATLAAAPGQLDAFTTSTREALTTVFQGRLSLTTATRATEVYIRSVFASAWPNAVQGMRLLL